MAARPKDLNGHLALYPYLQKELPNEDYWLFQMLASRLVTAFGIWLPKEVYARFPILLPHVIRAESANGGGKAETSGSPDKNGYLLDTNILIRNLVKSLPFDSPRSHYQGRRIGSAPGWVAAHVWQVREDGQRPTRHHVTNSFVPNLVWLPKTLATLSDHNPFVQQYLQALSHKIYSGVEQRQAMKKITANAWRQLEIPEIPPDGLPDPSKLNYFALDDVWLQKLRSGVADVLKSLERTSRRKEPVETLLPRRYRDGLRELGGKATVEIRAWLKEYRDALDSAARP